MVRRQQEGGGFKGPPYPGYPFLMLPELGTPYLANGALSPGAARTVSAPPPETPHIPRDTPPFFLGCSKKKKKKEKCWVYSLYFEGGFAPSRGGCAPARGGCLSWARQQGGSASCEARPPPRPET